MRRPGAILNGFRPTRVPLIGATPKKVSGRETRAGFFAISRVWGWSPSSGGRKDSFGAFLTGPFFATSNTGGRSPRIEQKTYAAKWRDAGFLQYPIMGAIGSRGQSGRQAEKSLPVNGHGSPFSNNYGMGLVARVVNDDRLRRDPMDQGGDSDAICASRVYGRLLRKLVS